MSLIPDGLDYEHTENEMEQALAACKNDLRGILWFAPVDGVQAEQSAPETPEGIPHESLPGDCARTTQ